MRKQLLLQGPESRALSRPHSEDTGVLDKRSSCSHLSTMTQLVSLLFALVGPDEQLQPVLQQQPPGDVGAKVAASSSECVGAAAFLGFRERGERQDGVRGEQREEEEDEDEDEEELEVGVLWFLLWLRLLLGREPSVDLNLLACLQDGPRSSCSKLRLGNLRADFTWRGGAGERE
ncbi:hypothetical protein INR49_010352 [Caranx melampygus]|nr:hypothetical protein INR49_010352 [Caranx melampygus]